MKRLPAVFYVLPSGREPVREWLRSLDRDDRKIVGEDIKDVEFSWPIGMGKSFRGVYDLAEDRIRVFRPGEDRVGGEEEIVRGIDDPAENFGLAGRRLAYGTFDRSDSVGDAVFGAGARSARRDDRGRRRAAAT
mgnify:CR=1 FL=1